MIIPIVSECEGFFIGETFGGERGHITHPISTNMILDSGIRKLLNSDINVLQYISVGTGNSPPTASQTMLDSRLATTNRKAAYEYKYVPIADAPEAYGQTMFSCQFDRGVAAGNLTEVAVGWTADGTENWSRSLFKDSASAPTAITVKSDEFFRVTYILKRYVPIPWVGSMTYDDDGLPATTEVTVSPGVNTSINGNGSAGNRRHVHVANAGSGAVASFGTSPQYNQLLWKVFFDLDFGNPQIATITTGTASGWGSQPQLIPAGTTITFDPPIPKTNEFDVTVDLLLTVARRVP